MSEEPKMSIVSIDYQIKDGQYLWNFRETHKGYSVIPKNNMYNKMDFNNSTLQTLDSFSVCLAQFIDVMKRKDFLTPNLEY